MKNLQALGNLSNLGNPSVAGLTYLLYDQYLADIAAGSVNGTTATPTGGTRTVTDVNTKLSITSGLLSWATGEAVNTGLWYPSQTRTIGKMLLGLINTNGNSNANIGWSVAQSTSTLSAMRFTSGSAIQIVRDSTAVVVAAYTNSTNYNIAIVMRSSGVFSFIKGGTEYTNWTLIDHNTNRNSNMFPGAWNQSNTTLVITVDNMRIPSLLWLPTPSAYDTFTRANGTLGTSETSGPDSQAVAAHGWTDTLGTWAIATNAAAASALSGGSAFETMDAGVADILIDANLTRNAGVCGIVLRYADSSNYLIAYHDGTNAKLDKVIGGSTTNIISAVAAFGAGNTLRVVASGSSFRLFYNNLSVGSAATIADAAVQTTTLHGLYTTDTGNTFDNFTIMPRGTNNEYGTLDRF